MVPKTRWMTLLGLLAVSTALVAFGDRPEGRNTSGMDEAMQQGSPSRPGLAARDRDGNGDREAAMIQEIRPRTAARAMTRAFAPHDWAPPPPPAASQAPPPPPAPTAPPLPFAFLGKKFEEGHWQVFLGVEEKTYIVRETDSIDGMYRIDAINPPVMALTYMPLLQQQTLNIGDDQ